MNTETPLKSGPIGIFDSGYGGLTILENIRKQLPWYDYVYLGDNARAPYGTRSFDVVYQYTRQAVLRLFDEGCQVVVLACNTASAKALRTIQQIDLPAIDQYKRVLGIIRPTVEAIGDFTRTGKVGIVGTVGTIQSESYPIEISKLFPHVTVYGEACPMWVPLVENEEYNSPGADYFVKQHIDRLMNQCADIDTLLLGCTHYPLLLPKIKAYLPSHVQVVSQGALVAKSLASYFIRHPEKSALCTRGGGCRYLTTESKQKFAEAATVFLGEHIDVEHIIL